MSNLSVTIVTKNEENNIRDCLESVKFADEIILIDSFSTDKTVDIAKEYTDKIIVTNWKGCGPQKEHAFSLATCEWVLMLDADERVTKDLQKEIKEIISKKESINSTSEINGYNIPFASYYLGKRIRFGDWFNEKHIRLFKRSQAKIVPRYVHYGLDVKGKIGNLNGKILHYSFPNISTVLRKIEAYSTDGAIVKKRNGKSSSVLKAIGRGLFTFIRGYILKLGFLDGKEGFMLAISNAEGTYYRYLKLAYLNKP